MASKSDLIAQLKAIDGSSFASDDDRQRAIAETRALLTRLEQPIETAWRLNWEIATLQPCIRTATQLDLFRKWIAFNNGAPASADDLAKSVSCDPELLTRILRHLAATNVLEYGDEPGFFKMTPFSTGLTEPEIEATFGMYFDFHMSVIMGIPEFLRRKEYKNPADRTDTAFLQVKGTDIMSFLHRDPKMLANLGLSMKATSRFRGNLTQDFPLDEIVAGADASGPLFVDVAGGSGYDTAAFFAKYPQKKGRVFVEDLPDVVAAAKLDPAIETVPFELFKPQPIEGAAIYYMHSVLHDWPDADCVKILTNLRPAMRKGYSRLIVHELVVPANHAASMITTSDITMLALASASERTEEDWRSVLAEAGFQISRIVAPQGKSSIIEAVLS